MKHYVMFDANWLKQYEGSNIKSMGPVKLWKKIVKPLLGWYRYGR